MPSISEQLKAFRDKVSHGQQNFDTYSRESPLDRTRREIQQEIARDEAFRLQILEKVSVFSSLSKDGLISAARSMEELFLSKGDIVIQQDDIGDYFYVLEDGRVSVTRKINSRDPNEQPKELRQLDKNAHFGEIALQTAEPRSATITVISDYAKLLRLSKAKYEELVIANDKVSTDSRIEIVQNVMDVIPFLKSLSAVNKKKLQDAMILVSFEPNSYICRQGTAGNNFFIITEGNCKVTKILSDGSELEVAKFFPGDYFGEVALISNSNRRTANVISVDHVNCMSLNRSDFNRLLKHLKAKLMENQALRNVELHSLSHVQEKHAAELKRASFMSQKRRITGYNNLGQRDPIRITSLYRRLCKYMTESLWNSLYSRLFREMLLDPSKCADYGKLAGNIMKDNNTRHETVTALQLELTRILELDCARRSTVEHSLVQGLLQQRNHLKHDICKGWPPYQFSLLVRKVKFMKVKPFTKIVEADEKGSTAFLIIRGAVRIFGKTDIPGLSHGGADHDKAIFQEDLFPGEVFGDAALSGDDARTFTALSMTGVELAVIEYQDFLAAQDRNAAHMSTEQKAAFISQVSLFKKSWDPYKLLRLAQCLHQEEIEKNVVITKDGEANRHIYFIVHGRVNMLDSLRKRNVVTVLHEYDYLGESGFCNKMVKSLNGKATEACYCVAATKLEVLVLHDSNFSFFDSAAVESIRSSYVVKHQFRVDRMKAMKWERAKVRKQFHLMRETAVMVQQKKEDGESEEKILKEAQRILNTAEQSWGDTVTPKERSRSRSRSPDSRAGSRAGSPQRPNSRPGTPKKQSESGPSSSAAAATGLRTTVDAAYIASLIHPLDERLQNERVWEAPDDLSILSNIQTIPTLLNKEFDLLMVTASSTNMRFVKQARQSITLAKRPLSGKKFLDTLKHSHKDHSAVSHSEYDLPFSEDEDGDDDGGGGVEDALEESPLHRKSITLVANMPRPKSAAAAPAGRGKHPLDSLPYIDDSVVSTDVDLNESPMIIQTIQLPSKAQPQFALYSGKASSSEQPPPLQQQQQQRSRPFTAGGNLTSAGPLDRAQTVSGGGSAAVIVRKKSAGRLPSTQKPEDQPSLEPVVRRQEPVPKEVLLQREKQLWQKMRMEELQQQSRDKALLLVNQHQKQQQQPQPYQQEYPQTGVSRHSIRVDIPSGVSNQLARASGIFMRDRSSSSVIHPSPHISSSGGMRSTQTRTRASASGLDDLSSSLDALPLSQNQSRRYESVGMHNLGGGSIRGMRSSSSRLEIGQSEDQKLRLNDSLSSAGNFPRSASSTLLHSSHAMPAVSGSLINNSRRVNPAMQSNLSK